MKNIFFIRHAKSSWQDENVKDHDRVLNPRGERDAPRMAQFLHDKGHPLDFILTSTASRAKDTAKAFKEAYQLADDVFWEESELYHAMPLDILACMVQIPEEFKNVAIFGHNPGMTHLANYISSDPIDNVPTCGIVHARTKQHYGRLTVDSFFFENFWIPKEVIVE